MLSCRRDWKPSDLRQRHRIRLKRIHRKEEVACMRGVQTSCQLLPPSTSLCRSRSSFNTGHSRSAGEARPEPGCKLFGAEILGQQRCRLVEAMNAFHYMIPAPGRKHFLTLGCKHPRAMLPLLASPRSLNASYRVSTGNHKAHAATLALKIKPWHERVYTGIAEEGEQPGRNLGTFRRWVDLALLSHWVPSIRSQEYCLGSGTAGTIPRQ